MTDPSSRSLQRPEDFGIGRLFWVMSDAIVGADIHGDSIVLWNPAAERLFGYTAREAIGMSLTKLVPDELHAAHVAGISRFRSGGEPRILGGDAVEVPARTRSGDTVNIALTLADVSDGPDRRYIVAVIRDVTELRATQRDLEQVNTSMREFVATASHDLRTPLASILGFADLLADEETELAPAQRSEFAQAIVRNADRATRLVDDLLTMSQIQAGAVASRITSTSVKEVVADALASSGVEAEVHVEPGLLVKADSHHLERILVNLLTNAANHGGGAIAVRATRSGGAVDIRVCDQGEGVPEDFRPRLFQSFAKAAPDRREGTGLGLSIVRGLARAQGGDAFHEPAEGGGSQFGVRLPSAG